MGTKNPDDRDPWKVATAIAVFFPLGLYWLWKHPTLGKNKVWWRCAIAYSLIGSFVVFTQDRDQSGSHSAPPSGTTKLEEMRSRVSIGMSQKEVQKALGKPQAKHKMSGINGLPDEQWTFLNDSLGINFTRGRVTLIQP